MLHYNSIIKKENKCFWEEKCKLSNHGNVHVDVNVKAPFQCSLRMFQILKGGLAVRNKPKDKNQSETGHMKNNTWNEYITAIVRLQQTSLWIYDIMMDWFIKWRHNGIDACQKCVCQLLDLSTSYYLTIFRFMSTFRKNVDSIWRHEMFMLWRWKLWVHYSLQFRGQFWIYRIYRFMNL